MKKIYLTSLFGAIAVLGSFTSCNEIVDVSRGRTLSGRWQGDFGMYYIDEGEHRWDSYDTDLEFLPYNNSALAGHGYETDYYDYGPYDEIYHAFKWEVVNGIIYLYYCSPDDWNLDTWIRDYDMSNSRFTGYFENSSSRFELRKYESYFNWTVWIDIYGDYNDGYGYGYGYREGYVYSPTRANDDSASVKPAIIKMGSRFLEEKK